MRSFPRKTPAWGLLKLFCCLFLLLFSWGRSSCKKTSTYPLRLTRVLLKITPVELIKKGDKVRSSEAGHLAKRKVVESTKAPKQKTKRVFRKSAFTLQEDDLFDLLTPVVPSGKLVITEVVVSMSTHLGSKLAGRRKAKVEEPSEARPKRKNLSKVTFVTIDNRSLAEEQKRTRIDIFGEDEEKA